MMEIKKLATRHYIDGKSDNELIGHIGFGESVEIELYIWLEGCDEDCTSNLCRQTLRNLAVSFAGVKTDQ